MVAGYAEGALHYIGGSGFAEAYVDYTVDADGDLIFTSLETNTCWYALAAVQHGFGGGLTGSLTGAYHDFDEQAELWMNGATLEYEVVENLLVSIAGQYTSTEYDVGYKDYYISAADPVVVGTDLTHVEGTLADSEVWGAKLRVQRNF